MPLQKLVHKPVPGRMRAHIPVPRQSDPLSRWSKTLADYKPIDSAIVRVGSMWFVVFAGRYYTEPYQSRLEAIRALAMLDNREYEARQAEIRG